MRPHPPATHLPHFHHARKGRLVRTVTRITSSSLPLLGGLTTLSAVWTALSLALPDLPDPRATLLALRALLDPAFFTGTPHEPGILDFIASSLQRALLGFTIGTSLAVPLGLLMGRTALWPRVFDPALQLLRPISPFAWFPLAMLLLHDSATVLSYLLAVTAFWPTVLVTARAAAGVPRAYRDVARVYRFTPARFLTRLLIPSVLPQVLGGARNSLNAVWGVVVAAEVLNGHGGIGLFIRDAWQAGQPAHMTSALVLISVTGFGGDRLLAALERKVTYA